MTTALDLKLDRTARIGLSDQIRSGIEAAINAGALVPGARLPSWIDLAAQLGVARGTVRAAYERLQDAQFIVSERARGTRVADVAPTSAAVANASDPLGDLPSVYRDLSVGSGIFQMGVPSMDIFPAKLFARIRGRSARLEVTVPSYPDPRGEFELRREIAAHLAISRSIKCSPTQVFVTNGFTGALGSVLHALRLGGRSAWIENPGYPLARRALQVGGMEAVPVPVDGDGIDVDHGLRHAADASLALVTAGQQAPLGPTLSLSRRRRLIEWAKRTGAWVIEDDYLGELQLRGHAAPALASLDGAGRVIHIGSFSKTISPRLRLGFIVAPPGVAPCLSEVAGCLAPAPDPAVQIATAEFMRDGHYFRHLRRMKRDYAARRDALMAELKTQGLGSRSAGLAVLLQLPDGTRDDLIAREATGFGLAPAPLSPWYCGDQRRSGLLLGVTTVPGHRLAAACDRLRLLVEAAA